MGQAITGLISRLHLISSQSEWDWPGLQDMVACLGPSDCWEGEILSSILTGLLLSKKKVSFLHAMVEIFYTSCSE